VGATTPTGSNNDDGEEGEKEEKRESTCIPRTIFGRGAGAYSTRVYIIGAYATMSVSAMSVCL